MRLTLALVTSTLLASAAAAQSIAPELQTRTAGIVYAPVVGIAPALAAPSPIATASVDRAEISPEPIAPQAAPAQAPVQTLTAVPTARSTVRPSRTVDDDEKLQPVRRAKVASERQDREPRRIVERERDEPVQRARSYTTGTRDLGRFWPPVF